MFVVDHLNIKVIFVTQIRDCNTCAGFVRAIWSVGINNSKMQDKQR